MIYALYDDLTDALSIMTGEAHRSFGDEQPDGLLFRYSYGSHRPIGVTVFSFKIQWQSRQDQMASRISDFLRVPAEDIKKAIVQAVH